MFITAARLEKDLVRLTIAAKGKFTGRILAELQPGRTVWMNDYGDFIVRTGREHDVVLIAGGTGITPFVAFMEDALVRGLDGNVWLHYGARSQDLLVFRDFAYRCARQFPAFRWQCYAETGATDATIAGRIDLERIVACVRQGKAAAYYLCGPQEMINAFRARLTGEFAISEANVKIDAWE